jgi:hypothetical protein
VNNYALEAISLIGIIYQKVADLEIKIYLEQLENNKASEAHGGAEFVNSQEKCIIEGCYNQRFRKGAYNFLTCSYRCQCFY